MKSCTKIQSGVLLFALLLILSLSGCKNMGKKGQNAEVNVSDTIKKEIMLSPESQTLLYKFPTPFQVTQMLIEAQAGYIFDITNSPDNVTKYVTEKSKALNLGIYSADLSYSATYNRTDETNKFIGATGKLADELGISGVYDKTLVERTKKFSNNKDSLVNMLNKVFNKTNDFLSKNNRNQVTVLITAGGFTEGLFLTALLAELSKDNKKLMAVIASQKENYEKLASILEAYKYDEYMKPVFDEVAKLKPIWEKYDIGSGKKVSQQNAKEISVTAEAARTAFIK